MPGFFCADYLVESDPRPGLNQSGTVRPSAALCEPYTPATTRVIKAVENHETARPGNQGENNGLLRR